ncbi:MAG: YitT family protein [Desulfitobacteriaceae bacterium]
MVKKKRNKIVNFLRRYALLFIGSVLAAIGLEIFLVPNDIIDGGLTGISIMASYLTKLPLGAFIFTLNLPFLVLGYFQIGKTFVLSTLFSITILSIGVSILHPVPGLTNDILLATVFGGIILGIGVGLVVRYGGSLDGTEMIAIVITKRTGFSVGEIVMFINIFILSSAGFVFGWDRAMYSLLAYFIVFKVIDLTIQGLDESKALMIISDKTDEIAEVLMARLGRGVTFLEGKGGHSGQSKGVLYSVITRLEIAKLKLIIDEIDENAFVTIHDVHEVFGGQLKKKAIHPLVKLKSKE